MIFMLLIKDIRNKILSGAQSNADLRIKLSFFRLLIRVNQKTLITTVIS